MALSNKERQKRWLAKNRAVFNFRRRQARRKKALSGGSPSVTVGLPARTPSIAGPPTQKSKIEELRELIAGESVKVEKEPEKTAAYRDDFGRVISERQWKFLQDHKRKAKEVGYEIDEFVQ